MFHMRLLPQPVGDRLALSKPFLTHIITVFESAIPQIRATQRAVLILMVLLANGWFFTLPNPLLTYGC
jgi:hypothetical protein